MRRKKNGREEELVGGAENGAWKEVKRDGKERKGMGRDEDKIGQRVQSEDGEGSEREGNEGQ